MLKLRNFVSCTDFALNFKDFDRVAIVSHSNGHAMRGQTEDEGGRCPFLLEHDDSKIAICMCNYYSLGQVGGAMVAMLVMLLMICLLMSSYEYV